MSERPESDTGAPDVAPAETNEKPRKAFAKRNPDAWIEERQRRLYRKMLNGMPPRALVLDHAAVESISLATAWRDYAAVQKWHEEDWQQEKGKIVSRIQQMRLRCIDGAIRSKQFSTAQMLLRDLGAVVGEVSPEAAAASAPSLSIVVEDKRQTGAPDA